MNAGNILFSTDKRLRAPWRILLFIVILFVALLLGGALENATDDFASRLGYRLLVSEWGVPLGSLVATWVSLSAVEGRGWKLVGMDHRAARAPLLLQGAALGLLPIAVPSLILLAAGELSYVAAAPGNSLAASGLSFANLLPAAFGEELLLRGYLFAVLRESIGDRWTLVSTSITFGLLHVANPGAEAQSILVVMLAGFFLGSVFLATRSLYAATVAHFAWNWFMAAGLHAPVSGLPVSTPDYRVIDTGPDWLTGGVWGPEGGLAAAFGMFVVLIYLHARPLRRLESFNA
ncbi:MAG: type II CAAX endopeptidase family protein [Gemmatimonadaceae bacterium]